MPLQLSDRVRALGKQAQDSLAQQFSHIDEIAEINTQKVLSAFQWFRRKQTVYCAKEGIQ